MSYSNDYPLNYISVSRVFENMSWLIYYYISDDYDIKAFTLICSILLYYLNRKVMFTDFTNFSWFPVFSRSAR